MTYFKFGAVSGENGGGVNTGRLIIDRLVNLGGLNEILNFLLFLLKLRPQIVGAEVS